MIGYIHTIRCPQASKMRRDGGYIGTNNCYTGRQRQHKNVKTHLACRDTFGRQHLPIALVQRQWEHDSSPSERWHNRPQDTETDVQGLGDGT
jgi:hypothetical protein